jgi:hypothetical protein
MQRQPVGEQPPAKDRDGATVMVADDVAAIRRRMDEIRAEEEAWLKKVPE